MAHEGHIVNESSILTHARIESEGGTALNTKNGLICFFSNRTYDSTLIYRIVKKTSDIAVW